MKLLFMGRKEVAAQTLQALCARPDVDVVGVLTDHHLDGSPTAAVAKRQGLPLFTLEEALHEVERGALEFDLGISILYWRKLRGPLLVAPRRGIINFHPAPLPQYKGTAGYNLAILEARDSWGVSAHYVDAEIDTGSIIKVLEFPIDVDHELCLTLERKSMSHMRTLIDDVLGAALASEARLPTTPNVGGRYVSRAEMEAMKRVQPGDDVARKVRAFWFPPYDGAFIEIDGERFTLVSRALLQQLAPAGTTSLFSHPTGAGPG